MMKQAFQWAHDHTNGAYIKWDIIDKSQREKVTHEERERSIKNKLSA